MPLWKPKVAGVGNEKRTDQDTDKELRPLKTRRPGLSRIRRVELKKTLFVLPNLLTLASVFCGFNSIRIVAFDSPSIDDYYSAGVLILFAMLFDLLDGRVARLTRTQSAFGIEADSLADVISFGVAPALLVYKWALYHYPLGGTVTAFLFVAGGVIRLARFNVLNSDGVTRPPGKYIVGLPIPPAAGILVALVILNHALDGALDAPQFTGPIFGITLLLAGLMVSTIKFRSFKDLKLNVATLVVALLGVGSSVAVWQLTGQGQAVLAWLPAFYVLLGLIEAVRELVLWVAGANRLRASLPPPPGSSG